MYQLIVQYQMLSPGNIHTSTIIGTEHVIFRNIYVSTYIYIIINEKNHEFEREKGE